MGLVEPTGMTGAAPGLGGGTREGRVESGGEGEAQVPQHAAPTVGADVRIVLFEELVEGVDCGVCGFPVDWWDRGFFEALDKIIDRGGCHGGGGKELNNN